MLFLDRFPFFLFGCCCFLGVGAPWSWANIQTHPSSSHALPRQILGLYFSLFSSPSFALGGLAWRADSLNSLPWSRTTTPLVEIGREVLFVLFRLTGVRRKIYLLEWRRCSCCSWAHCRRQTCIVTRLFFVLLALFSKLEWPSRVWCRSPAPSGLVSLSLRGRCRSQPAAWHVFVRGGSSKKKFAAVRETRPGCVPLRRGVACHYRSESFTAFNRDVLS